VPITLSDLAIRLSVKSGTAGNQTVQANPNLALGKYMSLTAWAGGVLADLFSAVTGDANAAQTPEYRCVFLYNSHPTLTWTGVVMWVDGQGTGATVSLGVDTTAAALAASASPQALEVANALTAPVGVSFSAPTSKGTGIAVGDIGPGRCKAVWFKRVPAGAGAVNSDTASVKFSGDTAN